MGRYSVLIKKSAGREIEELPKADLVKVLARIEALADDPRPPGSEKLAGLELYRVRQGQYRIIYSIEDDVLTVWVVKVGHRREVYRR
jgi:mRNA interferase RelE/StbE